MGQRAPGGLSDTAISTIPIEEDPGARTHPATPTTTTPAMTCAYPRDLLATPILDTLTYLRKHPHRRAATPPREHDPLESLI